MSDRRSYEEALWSKKNLKLVAIDLKSFDLVKFRSTLSINANWKYYKAISSDSMFRVASFNLVKFRLTLSISIDRKYYKSASHDQKSHLSIRWYSFSKDKEFLVFLEKIKNFLSSLTMIKIAQVIEQEVSKRVRIFNLSIKIARDEKVRLSKKKWFRDIRTSFARVLKNQSFHDVQKKESKS